MACSSMDHLLACRTVRLRDELVAGPADSEATPPNPEEVSGPSRIVGAAPVASVRRSDWWLSALSPGPWRRLPAWLRIVAPAAPRPSRRFGPVYAFGAVVRDPVVSRPVAGPCGGW